MIPSTDTSTLLFVSTQPAWEHGVELEQGMTTSLFTSRAGLEQRQQRRMRGQWKITYSVFYGRERESTRWARNQAEVASPLVVPFWTERALLTLPLVADVAQINRAGTPDFFAPGDFIFLTDGTNSQFRQISSYGVSEQVLNLVSLGAEELTFATGTKVYPCRVCLRASGEAEVEAKHDASQFELVTYISL